VLNGGLREDMLEGDIGFDTLYGGRGDDELFGGAQDDDLFGGNGDDILDGGTSGDYLYGGRGDDILTGGVGADVFVFELNGGHDIVTDYLDGTDQIDLSAFDFTSIADAESHAINVNGGVLFDFSSLGYDASLFIEGTTKFELHGADYIL
jgi:Ca2+-binding RTX toxin-like protein